MVVCGVVCGLVLLCIVGPCDHESGFVYVLVFVFFRCVFGDVFVCLCIYINIFTYV